MECKQFGRETYGGGYIYGATKAAQLADAGMIADLIDWVNDLQVQLYDCPSVYINGMLEAAFRMLQVVEGGTAA